MTEALLLIVLSVVVIAFFYAQFVWFERLLKSAMKEHMQPDEHLYFESFTTRSRPGLAMLFSFRQGYVMVTNFRLLVGWWAMAPFWKTIDDTLLRDIDDVKMVGSVQVRVTAHGRVVVITPVANQFWPFPGKRGMKLAEEINAGRAVA